MRERNRKIKLIGAFSRLFDNRRVLIDFFFIKRTTAKSEMFRKVLANERNVFVYCVSFCEWHRSNKTSDRERIERSIVIKRETVKLVNNMCTAYTMRTYIRKWYNNEIVVVNKWKRVQGHQQYMNFSEIFNYSNRKWLYLKLCTSF